MRNLHDNAGSWGDQYINACTNLLYLHMRCNWDGSSSTRTYTIWFSRLPPCLLEATTSSCKGCHLHHLWFTHAVETPRECPGQLYLSQKLMLSIHHGKKSKLSLKNWLHVIYLWAVDTPLTTTVEAIGISARTTVNLYNFLRDVCSWKLLQQPILLGGPGVIVQIDESLFKHKPKVKASYIHAFTQLIMVHFL